MFFIVNKTTQPLVIADIKLSLGPRQAIDLDRIMGREKSESSKDLLLGVREGKISVKRKDEVGKVIINTVKESNVDIEKIKRELLAEMKSGFKELKEEMKPTTGGVSIEEITKVMREIVASMPQASETTIIREVGEAIKKSSGSDIPLDPLLLSEIHKKAVNRMMKDSKVGRIDLKEEKTDVDDLDSKIDELDGLLG